MRGINNRSPRRFRQPVISGCLAGLGQQVGSLTTGKLDNTTTKGKGLFMKTAIKRRIGYAVMWGMLAHVPLLSNAQTNYAQANGKVAGPEPIILGPEYELDQQALSLRQQSLSLRTEAMSLRQEALNFRQEPLTPSNKEGIGLKLETLSANLEALSLRQESLSFGQHLLMANMSTNPPATLLSLSTNPPSGTITGSIGSNSCCPSYCGFINFNNGSAGFTCLVGKTFTITLSLSPSMNPLINSANYCARWRYGGQPNQTGCFSVISPTEQQFTAPVTAQYTITVYIRTNCPPNGTMYYMSYVTPPPT